MILQRLICIVSFLALIRLLLDYVCNSNGACLPYDTYPYLTCLELYACLLDEVTHLKDYESHILNLETLCVSYKTCLFTVLL